MDRDIIISNELMSDSESSISWHLELDAMIADIGKGVLRAYDS